MMHEMREIYTYKGKRYDEKALSKELHFDVSNARFDFLNRVGICRFHRMCDYKKSNRASFDYITPEGIKTGWQFGEKVFFDTEEERDAERAKFQKSREENKHRVELLNRLQELSTEELERIVANI